MGAGDSKPKPADSPPASAPKSPEKAPEPKAPEPTPTTAPVAKAPAVAPTPTETPPTETPPKTAAEAAASIAAPGKEEEPKAKPKAKGESKKKAKAKAKADGEKNERPEFQCCVRNLGEDATEEQLKTLFEPFGTVGTITMIRKPDGKCRGLAFISLGSADEVSKAIAEMDKKSLDGKEISVAHADGKKEKAAEKGAKGKSKGKEKGEKGDKGKGKGKGKKGEERRESQQVGYIPPSAYGQQPMYGYQYPYNPYGQYAYTTPQMQAAQLAQMQYMAQSFYAAAQLAASGGNSPKASGAIPSGPVVPNAFNTEYTGTLKSLSSRNGYGFIDWPENNTYKWYVHDDKKKGLEGQPRNVYVAAELLPEDCKAVGAKLKFTVTENSKRHPQASSCKAA